ncbi:pancreatic lipase-related protein 2-like [Anneissia japonica]|uniref:pancreatic lipase-related protein 2-like n=1 Tax=Anneissia japonica TaxID=1529436 RepID=UPI001425AF58|nr:pancreatic lipase-related protein 2-like [Anneissia japonica]
MLLNNRPITSLSDGMTTTCNMFKLMFYFLVLICSLNNAEVYAIRKCYGELGCFDSYGFPFNKLPSSRDEVGTKFTIQSRYITEDESLSANDVSSSSFNSAIPTKFIIHGFDQSNWKDRVTEMRQLLLIEGNYNVIIVDWEEGAGEHFWDYYDAVGNSRIVGAEIDLLINKFQSVYRISLSSVHLIGFSLGAHVAGFAGDRLNGRIGRITGLDPAKPGFEDENIYRRLDHTDAAYVDIIHTDANLWGINHSVGDVDYYPSGGEDQPGCEWYRFPSIACDHLKALKYFIESIEDQQQFSCEYYREKYDDICFEE